MITLIKCITFIVFPYVLAAVLWEAGTHDQNAILIAVFTSLPVAAIALVPMAVSNKISLIAAGMLFCVVILVTSIVYSNLPVDDIAAGLLLVAGSMFLVKGLLDWN